MCIYIYIYRYIHVSYKYTHVTYRLTSKWTTSAPAASMLSTCTARAGKSARARDTESARERERR